MKNQTESQRRIGDSKQYTETKNAGSCLPAAPNTGRLVVVGLRGFKLNSQLARYLRENPKEREQRLQPHPSIPSYHAPHWRVRDRLSKQDIADIVRSLKAGTAKHVQAKRYGMNLRSLKKLLREEGVKRKSWNDIQP